MKYCTKCGWEMSDSELFCPNCGNQVFPNENNQFNDVSYVDDTPPRQLSQSLQIAIKILLILAIVVILFNGGKYLLTGTMLNDSEVANEAISEVVEMPEFAELMQELQMDTEQLIKIVQIGYYALAVINIIPLCWVLPMRKKILKAMKNGTNLTTGFKICTLLFVNLIAGILLLCSKDI